MLFQEKILIILIRAPHTSFLSIAKFVDFKKGTSISFGDRWFSRVPLSIFPECNFNLVDRKKKIDVVNAVCKVLNLKNITTYKSRAEDLNLKYDFMVSESCCKDSKTNEMV